MVENVKIICRSDKRKKANIMK